MEERWFSNCSSHAVAGMEQFDWKDVPIDELLLLFMPFRNMYTKIGAIETEIGASIKNPQKKRNRSFPSLDDDEKLGLLETKGGKYSRCATSC